MRFANDEFYLKSEEEMRAGLIGIPDEAMTNTVKIAEQCSKLQIQLKAPPYHFPIYDLPEGMTLETEFCRMAGAGLDKRLEKHPNRATLDEKEYRDRLDAFYPVRDAQNCERTYQVLRQMAVGR